MSDKLIFGKNDLDRIVNIEINDDIAEIYREMPDGSIDIQYASNRFWLLMPFNVDESMVRLNGDLHYKWGIQFKTRSEFSTHRYLSKHVDTYSIYNAQEACMVKDGYTYFKNMKIDEVSVLSFDIETTGFLGQDNKLLLISNTFRRLGKVEKKLFAYDDFKSEGEMIEAWCKWVKEKNPAVLMGHNVNAFDLPFIQEVADREGVQVTLGRNDDPIEFNSYESQFRKDGSQSYSYHKCHIYGREIIDTMFLAIKYDIGRRYTSYGLKNIIKEEGLEKEGRVFYDAMQIKNNYKNPVEWAKIKEYCIDDSDDALALYDLMGPTLFYLTQSVPKTFQTMIESASGAQLNAMMTRSYLQDGHSLPRASPSEKFEGATSFGNPGIFKNVFKVDVASLYPNIMLQYEISDKKKDPNGNLLQILKIFTEERLKNKKLAKETGNKYYDDRQNAQKIVINSLYGFMGAEGLSFNFPEGAAEVTHKGRLILAKAINWAETNKLTVVNGDTDSIAFSNTEPLTEEQREAYLTDLNSLFPPKIKFEDDGYYSHVIILKAKNYVLWDGDKLKIKGSALKSSTREKALKDLIDEIIATILNEQYDYIEIYNKFILKCMNIKTKEEMKNWSSKKTVTDKVMTSERTNESKIRDALGDTHVQEGDKVWIFFKNDKSLSLVEDFDGDYDQNKLMEKVYNTMKVFSNIIDMKQFTKYHLKTKRYLLANIADVG